MRISSAGSDPDMVGAFALHTQKGDVVEQVTVTDARSEWGDIAAADRPRRRSPLAEARS